MTTFDPNTIITESTSTEFVVVPAGEYTAYISKFDFREAGGKPVCELTWTLDDPELPSITGRDQNTVRQTLWLDVTPAGGLDMGKGKNVQLGRLRELFGQNKAGTPWQFGNLVGNVAKVNVTHRINQSNGQTNAQVASVAAID